MPLISSCRRALLVLLFTSIGVLGAPPGATAAVDCAGPLTVLVDRSASMAEHDPFGALRLAVAEGLDAARAARDGGLVRPFDAALGPELPVGPGSWEAAVAAALAGGDRGATALEAVLAEATTAAASRGRLIVITDPEAELRAGGAWRSVLGAVIVVGGPAGGQLRSVARGAGVSVRSVSSAAVARGAAAELCGGAGESVAPAVLIPGLRATTGEVRGAVSAPACRPAGLLAAWCAALVADGRRVWVPAAAPGGRGTVLDSTGRLADNAAALAAWWQRARQPVPPVLVGHSMGGLIAHAATRRGLRAASLVTVGTPHAGSYGADAYVAARAVAAACALSCPVAATQLLGAAAAVRRRFGAALGDLTREQRTRVAPLGRPAVPLATWASTTSRVPVLPSGLPVVGIGRDGYVTPNDGIVGQGSATGALAGLQPSVGIADGAARHSASVPPGAAPTQLGSPVVAGWVVATARALGETTGRRLLSAPRPRPARVIRGSGSLARRAATTLRTVGALLPGVEQPAPPQTVVVATAPMGVFCDGVDVPLVEVSRGLWFIDLGVAGCRGVSAAPSGASGEAWLLREADGVAAAPERLLAVRRRGPSWQIELRLSAPGRPTLRRGSRRLALAPARPRTEWGQSLRWRGVVRGRGASELSIRVAAPGVAPRVGTLRLP